MSDNERPITAKDLNREVFDVFDEYVHSLMGRRDFLNRIAGVAPAGLAAGAIVEFLLPKYAQAMQIAPDDDRLWSETISYTSVKGADTMNGLLTRPVDAETKLPGIIVVHENRGLNPHIEDVARRAGMANFIALAPDALTPLGGYPGNDDAGRQLQSQRSTDDMLEDFIAAFWHLATHPECSGHVGVVGFCFGGGIANQMAARLPDLGAAVPFYGSEPLLAEVSEIQAPLLLHFAELDNRINAGWPAYEAALQEHSKMYTAHIYAGMNHGFHNDTTPRYDESSAALAWERTIDFFNVHLRIPEDIPEGPIRRR
jgi:carboxymethylenebutenolidase